MLTEDASMEELQNIKQQAIVTWRMVVCVCGLWRVHVTRVCGAWLCIGGEGYNRQAC